MMALRSPTRYTEIKRLRQIEEISEGNPPLLFLLDEILSGTSSHARRIGAAAVIRSLVERGAIGLVTTSSSCTPSA